ncbi:15-hydroxyprostaglandin dehydrogenase [NAD(+)]-like [Actinia tenebrosa]|uniref:15-hydroxyprostaglandin dehydrogenase [NAD(+)] n=1 Tax=Actinia tenebrosa TaxID=6105 RepID=A0A6P8H836_ACTTE|nr:15-hydroxyprostaglandin dehydrogenase [NAD(+)]-like [Actinia tenebrosa]
MIIKGAVAIVTGGAGGIGRAFCVALLENEAALVVILDVNKEAGEKTQEELRSKYGPASAKFIACDISNKEELTNAFKETVDEHGRLDIVCNNAGIGEEVNWEKCIAVNLTATIQGTYLAFEYMKSGGVVVNTASMSAFVPIGLAPVYSTTKAGVVMFTRSIAKASLQSKGVRVCCICPGIVDTPLLPKDNPGMAEWIEKRGIVQPEFIAKGLLQLINDDSKNGAVMRANAAEGMGYMQFEEMDI